jgi:hypothetical protein
MLCRYVAKQHMIIRVLQEDARDRRGDEMSSAPQANQSLRECPPSDAGPVIHRVVSSAHK